MARKRLGDMLVDSGYITEEQLDSALQAQKKGVQGRLGEVLISQGAISEKELIEALQMQLGIDFIDLSKHPLSPDLTSVVPKNIARRFNVVPVSTSPDEVNIAMSDPLDFIALQEVKSITRKRVVPLIATRDGIERAIMTLYGNEGAARAIEEMKSEVAASAGEQQVSSSATVLGESEAANAPTIRLVNSIIERAATERASDVHLEPQEDELQVRMRVDGLMRNILTVPKDLQASVINRLKIMGGMNTTERRVPQDGRANVVIKQREIDLRISTLPTIYGESLVIRLLDKTTQLTDTASLGMVEEDREVFDRLLKSPNGVIIIVGPTGSGKSSTMYTMIRALNTEQVNLITLEDPVEYHIDGVNQVQINEKVGMTFASALRSVLRQDPDIIGVGEIRDGETAEIAMRAAITGHLVISTMHTYDAVSTVDRLTDIGVEPYLTASGLRGVISQRLVRRICPHCREEYEPAPEDFAALGMTPDSSAHFFHGKGCPMCFNTGYRGRTAVFEILPISPALRHAIAAGADRAQLEEVLSHEDFHSLRERCVQLVLDGTTTFEEAARTVSSME